MSAGRNDAGGGLLVDAAQVGHGKAHAVELLAELPQADAGLEVDDVCVGVMMEDITQVVEVDEPRGRACQVGGRVACACGSNAPSALTGEIDGLLDLLDGLRANIQLWLAGEGASPGLVSVASGGTEWDIVGRVLLDGVSHPLVEA